MAARLAMTVSRVSGAGRATKCGPDRAIRVESGSVAGRPPRQSGGAGRARPAGGSHLTVIRPGRIGQRRLGRQLARADIGPPGAAVAAPAGPAE
jgi:hypothetical protein